MLLRFFQGAWRWSYSEISKICRRTLLIELMPVKRSRRLLNEGIVEHWLFIGGTTSRSASPVSAFPYNSSNQLLDSSWVSAGNGVVWIGGSSAFAIRSVSNRRARSSNCSLGITQIALRIQHAQIKAKTENKTEAQEAEEDIVVKKLNVETPLFCSKIEDSKNKLEGTLKQKMQKKNGRLNCLYNLNECTTCIGRVSCSFMDLTALTNI